MKRTTILLAMLSVLTILMVGCSSLGLKPIDNGTENTSTPMEENDGGTDETKATIAKTIATNGTHTITDAVNGQILVVAEQVTLVLDGATLNCTDGAAILGEDGNGSDALQNLTVELRGTNTITASTHGIQGKDNLTVTGSGSVKISSGKDGLHAGDTLNVKSGTLDITAASDGMEAGNATKGTGLLHLEGGHLTVLAGGGSSGEASSSVSGGKGLKSGKDITVSGGTVIALIDSSADNNALDSDGEATITGGTVIAGGTGTFENIGSDSTQSYVYVTGVSSGNAITVESNGTTFASYAADQALSHLVIFAPGIISGQNYDVTVGNSTSSVTAGTGGGRSMGGRRGIGGGPGGNGGRR